MTLSGAIIRAMWQLAGHRGLDTEELRVRIGVSEGYWKALLMFNVAFHVSLLEKMAEALGVTATQLVTTAEELMAEERRARRPMESAILGAMVARYAGAARRTGLIEGEYSPGSNHGQYQRVLPDHEDFRAIEPTFYTSTPDGTGSDWLKKRFMAMNECGPRIDEMMAAAAEPWSTAHAEEPGGGDDHGRA